MPTFTVPNSAGSREANSRDTLTPYIDRKAGPRRKSKNGPFVSPKKQGKQQFPILGR